MSAASLILFVSTNTMKIVSCAVVFLPCVRITHGGKLVSIVGVCECLKHDTLSTKNNVKNKVFCLFSLFFFLSAGSGSVFNILVV